MIRDSTDINVRSPIPGRFGQFFLRMRHDTVYVNDRCPDMSRVFLLQLVSTLEGSVVGNRHLCSSLHHKQMDEHTCTVSRGIAAAIAAHHC